MECGSFFILSRNRDENEVVSGEKMKMNNLK